MKPILFKIMCFFNYHRWQITKWSMAYEKQCMRCHKKMYFIGYNFWVDLEE